ncbi:MAG: 16S rRNA (cytosine(967)-C(5))-methyltransferase RsmB [Burkholderiales bacterium]
MNDVQKIAALAVTRVLAGASLTATLETLRAAEPALTAHTRAAAQDAAYGTLRWLTRLQALLAPLLRETPADPRVAALLWVAAYQIEYTRAAPHAVVNAAAGVAGGWTHGHSTGFVNAVLRNFLRRREALAAGLATDEARYAHPRWWIEAVREEYPRRWRGILEANNGHPPFTLRVNRRRGSRDDTLAALAAAGIEARPVQEDGVLCARAVPVKTLPGFADGRVSVQDAGAQWAAPLLDARDGMRVLDACAAPGGKAAHLLERGAIELTALDRDGDRLRRVADNLERLGLTARLAAADAGEPAAWWDGVPYDRVLADVPCTASGIVRRHPDVKWLRRPTDLATLADEQARLLEALWRVLAVGGKLLYITCSIFARENDRQVAAFLSRHADARRLPLPALPAADGAPAGQLLPTPDHDGFYYAALEKV